MLDVFLQRVFKISKAISAIVVLICLAIIVWSMISFVFSGPSRFPAPQFSDFLSAIEESSNGSDYVARDSDEFKGVKKKYGKKVKSILSKYGILSEQISDERIDVYIQHLVDIPPEYRKHYVGSLLEFLLEYKEYLHTRQDVRVGVDEGFDIYTSNFEVSIAEFKDMKKESQDNRGGDLMTIAASAMFILLFLIIPLLIQIEANTQPK